MSEKRRWHRHKPENRAAQFGKILLSGGSVKIDCRVIDISAGGACLELSELMQLPDRFEFLHGNLRKVCKLVWMRRYRLGISYEASIERSFSSISDLSRNRRDSGGFSRFSR